MRRSALAAVAALLTGGCGLFGSSTGPKPAALPALEHPAQVRVLWSARVGGADRFTFSPALDGEAVYAAARNGTVVRLDAATGAERWRVSAGKPLSAGVGADSRLVVVGTAEGEVIALDAANGAARWRARVSSEVLGAPAIADGLVVVRSLDSRIFAFGEDDGERRWVYQRPPASLIVRAPEGVTLFADTAFAGFPGGKLVAIALANGGTRWEATVAVPKGATELERVTDVLGRPAIDAGEACAAAYQGRVACFELGTGRQVWAAEVSSLTGVSLDARYAYVSDEHGAVYAYDRTVGRSVWKQARLANRRLSLPVAVGETLAVGDFEGYVHFLARESGAFVARYATGGGAVRAAPVRLGKGWLVQTQDGSLIALAL